MKTIAKLMALCLLFGTLGFAQGDTKSGDTKKDDKAAASTDTKKDTKAKKGKKGSKKGKKSSGDAGAASTTPK